MFLNYYRGKKVFVTGHTGFKGSWLSQWLIDLGAEVHGYSISVPSTPSHWDLLKLESQMAHEFGDIRNDEQLTRAIQRVQPDCVFHLAAQPLVRLSYDQPRETFETNVMGTVNLLDAVFRYGRSQVLVNVTSDKCYENVEKQTGYRETDPMGGKDPYSASKGAAELVFSSFYRSFFARQDVPTQVVTVRAGNVIGGGDWADDRIIPDCVRSWTRGESVSIRSPQSVRPWQHVLEPLSGYLWLGALAGTQSGRFNGEGYNFGPSPASQHTVETLLKQFQLAWPKCTWTVNSDGIGNKKEATLLALDCTKAEKDLAWREVLDFAETVKWTADWYRQWNETGELLTHSQISAYSQLAQKRELLWTQSNSNSMPYASAQIK